MRRWVRIGLAALVLASVVVAAMSAAALRPELRRAATWQRQASPGELSAAHAFLEGNCTACHTPMKGVERENCVTCHANAKQLLGRQPTAFHADVASCRECHAEHLGPGRHPTVMDHAALAAIGLRELRAKEPEDEGRRVQDALAAWIRRADAGAATPSGHPPLTAPEATLNCATCHANEDRHREFFGRDCAQCHGTSAWSIPEFRHPSAESRDCAQCHLAPPSHYMEHFAMISRPAARQEHARPDQCYLCHKTTSWNDIQGVGWYKHH